MRHVFRYRLFRWSGRVVAIAGEVGRGEAGYRLEVGADHFEDPGPPPERIRAAARSAVGRVQLTQDEHGRLQLDGLELTGRLEESDEPYENPRVVIDGQSLTWEEFGDLLSPTKGWTFDRTLSGDARITADARSARPLAVDERAQLLLRQQPPQRFVIAIDHYPSPGELRTRTARDAPPTGANRRS